MNSSVPNPPPKGRRAGVAVMVLAALLAGCSGGADTAPSEGGAATATTVAGRTAAIETARAAVQGPTAALLDAAGTLAVLAEQWQADRAAVDLVDNGAEGLAAARAAAAAARGALDATAGPDIAAAATALEALADRVGAQADALGGLRADEAATRPVDALGATFVEQINARGSRTPQRLAMEALVEGVDALAPAVDRRLSRSTCPAPLRARARGLVHMRSVAQQLGELATTGQGHAFDALRAEATPDPFDAGTTDLETVASSTTCPEVALVVDTPQDLVGMLAALESALNPPDLVAG